MAINGAGTVLEHYFNTGFSGRNYQYFGDLSNSAFPQRRVANVYLATCISPNGRLFEGATLQKFDAASLSLTPLRNGRTGSPYVLDAGQYFH